MLFVELCLLALVLLGIIWVFFGPRMKPDTRREYHHEPSLTQDELKVLLEHHEDAYTPNWVRGVHQEQRANFGSGNGRIHWKE